MEPLRARPVPSYEKLLALCCTVTFACYLASYMRIPIVPLFARQMGADTVQVGLINSAFLLMAGVVSLPLGILSDRIGRKLLILCGLITASVTSFLLCFSASPQQVMGIYLLFGIGLAAFAPTMMSFVADFTPPTHIGRSYGWYTLALYVGMSVGPATGGMLAQWLSFMPVFALSGTLVLLVAAAVFFFLPRARQVVVHRPPKRPTREVARDLVHNGRLLACWLATLGGCLGLGMFITFVPLQAKDQGVSVGQIGLIFAIQAIVNALSRIPFGRLSDRVARRSNLVVVGLAGFAVAVAGLGFATRFAVYALCAAGIGISMGVAFTAIGALISEVVSPDCRGLAMGGYNSAIYLGMMLGSLVMGALIRQIGYANAFFLTGCVNLATTAIFTLVFHTRAPQVAIAKAPR